MRYEIDYRDATGRRHRRVTIAEDAGEVRRLIREERLRVIEVRPPIDGPPPVAQAALEKQKKSGAPLQVEIISRPTDLSQDRTGGKLPWMERDEEADVRENRKLAAYARHRERVRQQQRWVGQGRGSVTRVQAIEDALIDGRLEIGKEYLPKEIYEAAECHAGQGADMLAMQMAEHSDFRLVEVNGGRGTQSRWRIENKPQRAVAA